MRGDVNSKVHGVNESCIHAGNQVVTRSLLIIIYFRNFRDFQDFQKNSF